MKIAYVGNFKPSHSTENHLAATLEKLGHEVHRIQEDETSVHNLSLAIAGMGLKVYGLFLFTRTWGATVTLKHLEQLRKLKIPSVSYHLDLYVGLQRDGGIDTDPFWRTDFVFTPDGDPRSDIVFKSKGINHRYMKPGVFEDECYLLDVPKTHDLIFVGSYNYHPEWPYRQQLIEFLRRYGSRFEFWGDHPDRSVRGDALNQLYAGTRIIVGDSLCLEFNHPYYWSDRVYETLGRGGFLIHPRIPGMEDEFVDGEHLIFYDYGNWAQLEQLINHYYQNEEQRERIRLAGHEFVKANATYTNRLKQMFEILEAEGVC